MLDTFRDYDELKNKIEYYIDNEEIRIQYAQKVTNGRKTMKHI